MLGVLLASCQDVPTRPVTWHSSPAISDGAHNNGNEYFYFLPPIVKQPVPSGAFDGNQSPVVEVCALNGGTCVATVATFTTTSGPNDETVRVNSEAEYYGVNWRTGDFSLDDVLNYRIVVRVGTTILGFADVDVARNASEFKNLSTNDLIGLVEGRVLPIRFRIEQPAGCSQDGPWNAATDFSENENPA
jgi:hypothetical protein